MLNGCGAFVKFLSLREIVVGSEGEGAVFVPPGSVEETLKIAKHRKSKLPGPESQESALIF